MNKDKAKFTVFNHKLDIFVFLYSLHSCCNYRNPTKKKQNKTKQKQKQKQKQKTPFSEQYGTKMVILHQTELKIPLPVHGATMCFGISIELFVIHLITEKRERKHFLSLE